MIPKGPLSEEVRPGYAGGDRVWFTKPIEGRFDLLGPSVIAIAKKKQKFQSNFAKLAVC